MNNALPGTEALGALTVFVTDVDAEAAFHRDVLGLPLAFADEKSAVLMLGTTALNLLSVTAAGELVTPATSSPVITEAQMLLTLWVDDVDAVCAELARRGVDMLNGPIDRPWGKRTAAFTSPSGLVWEIAQDLQPGPGHPRSSATAAIPVVDRLLGHPLRPAPTSTSSRADRASTEPGALQRGGRRPGDRLDGR